MLTVQNLMPKPSCRAYTDEIESPKELLAYLKMGCELKQIGCNALPGDKRQPIYRLTAPFQQWEVGVASCHAVALETLGLVEVDCCGGNYWISKGNFELPVIAKTAQRKP